MYMKNSDQSNNDENLTVKQQIQTVWGKEWEVRESIDGYKIINKLYFIEIEITEKEIRTRYPHSTTPNPIFLLNKIVKTVQLMRS